MWNGTNQAKSGDFPVWGTEEQSDFSMGTLSGMRDWGHLEEGDRDALRCSGCYPARGELPTRSLLNRIREISLDHRHLSTSALGRS